MKAKRISTFFWVSTLIIVAATMVSLGQSNVSADSDPSSRVARLNYLRGSVSFQPAGEPDWVSAIVNRPITTGDRLWADENSRAEMHLGSATIRLDEQTGMSFLNLDDQTTQIELSEGVLNVRVLRLDRDEIFEIDTPNQAFTIERPGQYRIDASEDGHTTMVTVRSGEGEVTGGGRTYSVGSGVTGSFVGDDLLRANIYKSSGYDDFDQWCQDRDRRDDSAKSVRFVSREVVGYQDLDDYGYWQDVPGYGFVWFPRVSVGWAPYHDGHWAWISPWGWTWIDDAPWGYAPFHYGRWVAVRNTWAWIPGPVTVRPVYAPALVAFVGGPHFSVSVAIGGGGNVAWFPLGPREVYVPAYHTSREYVQRVNVSNTTVTNITINNVYNNTNNTNIHYVNKTVNGGVTAVSQTTFVNAQHVGKSAVVVNQRDIVTAPVYRRAEVTPSRNSVLGPGASDGRHVSQPRTEIVNRTVVVKTPPPAQKVSFERQQAKLSAQPGQPLASKDIESLRASNGNPHVRQAPPGKQTVADSMQAPSTPPINRHSPDKDRDRDGQSVASNHESEGHNNGNRGQMSSPRQTSAPNGPPTVVNSPGDNSQQRSNRPPSAYRGQSSNTPAPSATANASPTNVTPSGDGSQSRGNSNRPPSTNRGQSSNAPAQTTAPAGPPTVVTPSGDSSQSRGNNRPPNSNHGQTSSPSTQSAAPALPPKSGPSSSDSNYGRGNSHPETTHAPAPAQSTSNPPSSSSYESHGASRGRQPAPPQTSSQSPQSKAATPASSNSQPARGDSKDKDKDKDKDKSDK